MLPGRNEGQLRSYISKNISDEEIKEAMHGILPPEPEIYIYPPGFAPLKKQESHLMIPTPPKQGMMDIRLIRINNFKCSIKHGNRCHPLDWNLDMALMTGLHY